VSQSLGGRIQSENFANISLGLVVYFAFVCNELFVTVQPTYHSIIAQNAAKLYQDLLLHVSAKSWPSSGERSIHSGRYRSQV
jgi:hypothetical protein